MSGENVLLEVEALHFGYPGRPLLHGVELALERGELLALLGTNGSGKTTLLRLISGLLRPEAGEVRVAGRPVGAWRRGELARRLAVLPQRLELPAGFRVAEIVEMGRAPHASRLFGSTPADAAAVERALVDADAVELADRMADELSGGERQRVLVAMALAQEPQLLLLDEPTLHLDVAHRIGLLGTITRLQRSRRIGVLAVLHDLDLAAAFAPRVALLHEGRILADGPADEVLRGELLRRVFGVAIDDAFTADGRRHLVPHIGGATVGAD